MDASTTTSYIVVGVDGGVDTGVTTPFACMAVGVQVRSSGSDDDRRVDWVRFGNGVLWALVGVAGFLVVPRRIDHRGLVAVNAGLRAGVRRLRRELEWLRFENEVLREAAALLIRRAPGRERFAVIHRVRGRFAVERLCRILVTGRCSYCLWARAEACRRAGAAEERGPLGASDGT
jgi:hypothetical protein